MLSSLAEVDRAVRAAWAADTCSPDDAALRPWTPANPAWGHCDVTAAVLHDLVGGDLVLGDVTVDGAPRGHHWWNRLAPGVEVDLTREQFRHGEVVSAGRVVVRPPGPFRRRHDAYLLFRSRVLARLPAAASRAAPAGA